MERDEAKYGPRFAGLMDDGTKDGGDAMGDIEIIEEEQDDDEEDDEATRKRRKKEKKAKRQKH